MNYADTTQARLDRNWSRLEILCNDVLLRKFLHDDLFAKYQIMLNDLRHDRAVGGTPSEPIVVLGLRRAPASKDRHHNYEGGLIEHLLEMWNLWCMWKMQLALYGLEHKDLTNENVLRAILHHDLNKVWRYVWKENSSLPFEVDYYDRDAPAELLGSTGKALWTLQHYGIPMSLLLTNALICSEGGYSKTRPRAETAFAKLIYILDEGSANVVNRLRADRFWDSKDGGLHAIP